VYAILPLNLMNEPATHNKQKKLTELNPCADVHHTLISGTRNRKRREKNYGR